jgi:hypothetical protein
MSRFREEDRDVKNGAVVVPVNPTYMPVLALVESTGDPSLAVLIFHGLKCENCHWEPLTAVEERANAP